MKTAQKIGLFAFLALTSPGFAADMEIPPLNPAPIKASLPWQRPATPQPAAVSRPPTAPAAVTPEAPKAPEPGLARDGRPPLVPLRPEGSVIDPGTGEPAAAPTWLERFGPFLRSQLDMIITGSIGAKPACPAAKPSAPGAKKPCAAASQTRRGQGAQRRSQAPTPSAPR